MSSNNEDNGLANKKLHQTIVNRLFVCQCNYSKMLRCAFNVFANSVLRTVAKYHFAILNPHFPVSFQSDFDRKKRQVRKKNTMILNESYDKSDLITLSSSIIDIELVSWWVEEFATRGEQAQKIQHQNKCNAIKMSNGIELRIKFSFIYHKTQYNHIKSYQLIAKFLQKMRIVILVFCLIDDHLYTHFHLNE